jgi:glycosyltransferase involved in cell wall biosynthesis
VTDQVAGALQGRLERADREVIAGWAFEPEMPDSRVVLRLRIDGVAAGTVLADRFRADLRESGVGDGCHSFEIRLAAGLSGDGNRRISVSRDADGSELELSPAVIPGVPMDPEQALRLVAAALAEASAAGDQPAMEALLERLADRVAALEGPPASVQAAFLRRWGHDVPELPGPAPLALFIDEAIPNASADAGSGALLSHMRALQGLGFSVDFVPSWSVETDGAAVMRLREMGVRVWHAPWIASVEEVLANIGKRLDLVYLHRHGVMARYGALVRRWAPQARVVYSVADLHHVREARGEAFRTGDVALSAGVAALRVAELNAVLAADATITHSTYEAALLREAVPDAAVFLVPWAVKPHAVGGAFAQRRGVAFVGSYGHPPNLDAAFFLLDQVMKLVWAQDPDIPLLLAGSAMPDSLRARAAAAPGPVQVLGHVEVLDDLWSQSRISIAPLRFGAGVKGKVLDSLAAGVACICTPVAAEGIDLPESLQELVAHSAAGLAKLVVELHGDQSRCATLRSAALAFIEERFNGNVVRAAIAPAAGRADVPADSAGADPVRHNGAVRSL